MTVDPLPDAYWQDGYWLAYWTEYWPALPAEEQVHPTGLDLYEDEEELLMLVIKAFLGVTDAEAVS
jgi:hypothetical protein